MIWSWICIGQEVEAVLNWARVCAGAATEYVKFSWANCAGRKPIAETLNPKTFVKLEFFIHFTSCHRPLKAEPFAVTAEGIQSSVGKGVFTSIVFAPVVGAGVSYYVLGGEEPVVLRKPLSPRCCPCLPHTCALQIHLPFFSCTHRSFLARQSTVRVVRFRFRVFESAELFAITGVEVRVLTTLLARTGRCYVFLMRRSTSTSASRSCYVILCDVLTSWDCGWFGSRRGQFCRAWVWVYVD